MDQKQIDVSSVIASAEGLAKQGKHQCSCHGRRIDWVDCCGRYGENKAAHKPLNVCIKWHQSGDDHRG